MSLLRINLTDSSRSLTEEVHGGVAESIVAALSADPSTIEELELALGRFTVGENFSWYTKHLDFEPYDAGIVIVDLAAKMVASDQTYTALMPKGEVCFHDGKSRTDIPIRFWISDDWKFIDSIDEYEVTHRKRRHEFSQKPKTDYRTVLYGKELSEFLAANFHGNDISGCHADWLMTPREDLDGKTPREVLLEHQDRVDFDLYSRELQWSFVGVCPPLIPVDSEAFRFSGFGTHEFVMYHDLVRHMLANFSPVLSELEELKAIWLETPTDEGVNRIPSEIIEAERRRLPLEATAKEMMIDEDCPICQMMQAEFDTPTFMHLDGAHIDDAFEFSMYRTREEWDDNKRQWEEFNRRFEAGEFNTGKHSMSILEEDLIL